MIKMSTDMMLRQNGKLLNNKKEGNFMRDEKKATRASYGEALASLGEKNKDIVVLDADLATATKTIDFGKKFPQL